MKKNRIFLIAALLLACCLSLTAFAKSVTVEYSLTSDSSHEVVRMTGDIVEVRFSVRRVDDIDGFSVNVLQNYIRYDTEFFEVVEDSLSCQKNSASASLQDTLIGPRIYMADMTASYGSEQEFGSFLLKVIGTTGSGLVESTSMLAYDGEGNPIVIDSCDLRVTIDPKHFPILASSNTGGSITPSGKQIVSLGERVTFTISPDANYSIKELLIDGKPTAGVSSYTFEKVDRAHTIEAVFERSSSGETGGSGGGGFSGGGGTVPEHAAPEPLSPVEAEPIRSFAFDASTCLRDSSCPIDSFVDTQNDLWWHDGIHFCLENGLMKGIESRLFDPTGETTRGMIVTILWRIEGSPDVPTDDVFPSYTDVEDGWYLDAVRWASAEGVINGYGNGTFGPNDSITREQLAAVLYRYAAKTGSGFQNPPMLSLPFSDCDDISDWAKEAVQWCYSMKIVNGKDRNLFDPKGNASRSETAVMLERFCKGIEQPVLE